MNKAHDYPDITLDKSDPLGIVSKFLEWEFTVLNTRALHHHQGKFWAFNGVSYRELGAQDVRKRIYAFLRHAAVLVRVKGSQENELFQPNRHDVDNVIDALRADVHLSDRDRDEPPFWIDPETDYHLDHLIICKNMMFHTLCREPIPANPSLFATHSLNVAYNEQALEPAKWLWFLKELWGADQPSISMLQEWMGYLLTRDITLQKIMLIVGPQRAGKGTILNIIEALLGTHNYDGPKLSSLSAPFGLESLIGKQVAVISDARLNHRNTVEIAEWLLNISGGDTVTIPRKFQSAWVGKLIVRFMITTNELPAIEDASGALAGRYIVLRLTKSFYGREDTKLYSKLKKELPGILNWALEGLYRLTERGKFLQPASSQEIIRQIKELGSLITTFIEQCCVQGRDCSVSRDTLFEAWTAWCKESNNQPGTKESFGRDLHAAIPDLATTQPRMQGGRQVRQYQGIGLLPASKPTPENGACDPRILILRHDTGK